MNSGNTLVINDFFNTNYQLLLQKCRDYSRVYNYKELQPDEMVSELYLFTLNNTNRTNKLSTLIELTAATINKLYAYTNQAWYYLAKTIWDITKHHRIFGNKGDGNRKHLKLVYTDTFNEEIEDSEYLELNAYYELNEILEIAENLSKLDNNWYKYQVWKSKYIDQMTYKQLSTKYQLNITPLWTIVHEYNLLLRKELTKVNSQL